MTEPIIPAVIYAAKSTDDPHESIPGQLKDCRNLADDKGLKVVGEFKDKAKSAYSGDRGDDLTAALAKCEGLVVEHGSCSLIVQHSDRLARGDAKTAKHLVEYTLWGLKTGVTILSKQDQEMFPEGDYGLLMGAIGGMRNHQDSKRKAVSTRDGLQRRKERGKPIGAVPLGHRVEKTVVDGQVVTKRVIDPTTNPIIETAYDRIQSGATPGTVARELNAAGRTTKASKQFTAQIVRALIRVPAYKGDGGYQPIIDPDRWQRVNDQLKRMDPAAIQRWKGGRPTHSDFLLRGFLFCTCGQSMYSVHRKGQRGYMCSAVSESRGTCDSRFIPAVLIERHVLDHLSWFVGSVEDWLQGKVAERDVEQQARQVEVNRQRAALAALDRTREKLLAEYDRMVESGDQLARITP
jgi:DNA invertase Pin-like site-specific DNA recombinase